MHPHWHTARALLCKLHAALLPSCMLPHQYLDQIYQSIYDLISWHSQFQWREFVMGISWMIILIGFKEVAARVKYARTPSTLLIA